MTTSSTPLNRAYDMPRALVLLRYYSIQGAREYLVEHGMSGRDAATLLLAAIRHQSYGHLLPEWKRWFTD